MKTNAKIDTLVKVGGATPKGWLSKGPELRHLQYFPGGIIENGRGDGAMDENWAPEGCRFMTYINGDIRYEHAASTQEAAIGDPSSWRWSKPHSGIVFQEDSSASVV